MEREQSIAFISLGFNSLKPSAAFIPGKPHEEISIVQNSSGYKIKVSINIPRPGIAVYTEKSGFISKAEWDGLQMLIKQSDILSKESKTFSADDMADGSNLILVFRLSNQAQKTFAWTNHEPVSASEIINRLVNLANQNIPDNGLIYLKNYEN